jgi:hypothetical protein
LEKFAGQKLPGDWEAEGLQQYIRHHEIFTDSDRHKLYLWRHKKAVYHPLDACL